MKTQFKSAKIQIIVDDETIGKNQLTHSGCFVGSFIPQKIKELTEQAKNEYPNGKIRYELIVRYYTSDKRIKTMAVEKFKKVSLSEIDISFGKEEIKNHNFNNYSIVKQFDRNSATNFNYTV